MMNYCTIYRTPVGAVRLVPSVKQCIKHRVCGDCDGESLKDCEGCEKEMLRGGTGERAGWRDGGADWRAAFIVAEVFILNTFAEGIDKLPEN